MIPGITETVYSQNEILAHGTAHLAYAMSIQMNGSLGALPAGTILGRLSSGGYGVPYNNGGSGGAEIAVGILARNLADNGTNKETVAMYTAGYFVEANLTGLDSAAKTDLAAISHPDGVIVIRA